MVVKEMGRRWENDRLNHLKVSRRETKQKVGENI